MDNKKFLRDKLDRQYAKEIASQIPVITVRESYERMLLHCRMQDAGRITNLWACATTGADVKARMVHMKIFDRVTGQQIDYAPVVTLYCKGCDPVPNTHSGDIVFSDQLSTLSM